LARTLLASEGMLIIDVLALIAVAGAMITLLVLWVR
jgi:hypothetical protein